MVTGLVYKVLHGLEFIILFASAFACLCLDFLGVAHTHQSISLSWFVLTYFGIIK